MARYYPKSQLRTNLFTNGNEFKINKRENNNPRYNKNNSKINNSYVGYYHQTSEGLSFTGKTPLDSSTLLYPILLNESSSKNPSSISPKIIKSSNMSSYFLVNERYIPFPIKITPSEQNYFNGTFFRYFCYRNNKISYFEIDKSTYTDLVNKSPRVAYDLYTPILVNWILVGNKEQVFFSNKANVLSIQQTKNLPGFSLYFKNNFSQYYLES